MFSIVCREADITCIATDGSGQPLKWAWDITDGIKQKQAVQAVTSDAVTYQSAGKEYQLKIAADSGSCTQQEDGTIRLTPNASAKLVLQLSGI